MTSEIELAQMLKDGMKELENRIVDELLFEIAKKDSSRIPHAADCIDVACYTPVFDSINAKIGIYGIVSGDTPVLEEAEEKFRKLYIDKCNYNINYTINCLKQILAIVEQYKFSPRDLPITLKHSIEKMLAYLEVERDNLK